MNLDAYQRSLRQMFYQRNVLLGLTALLAVSQVVLSIFLFLKNEKTIIVPGVVEKEFWVSIDSVSPTYLEQYGYFIGQLLLNKSAHSASTQKRQLLRHTAPQLASDLHRKLTEEEAMLTKQNAAYVFYPVNIQVNQNELSVILTGDKTVYVAGKAVSTDRENYTFSFSYDGARLLLKEIKSMESQ